MFDVIEFAEDLNKFESRIVEFGRKIRMDSRIKIGYGPNPIYGAMVRAGGIDSVDQVDMSEEECELIGDAFMMLNKINSERAETLLTYYVEHHTINMVTLAAKLGVHRNTARERLDGALSWLQGYFINMAILTERAGGNPFLKAA